MSSNFQFSIFMREDDIDTNPSSSNNKTERLEMSLVATFSLFPDVLQQPNITHNLNNKIVREIASRLGLGFTNEKEIEGEVCFINNASIRSEFKTSFAPVDLLDYVYAILHSALYRDKYRASSKIEFPCLPYPKDTTFWQLVELGAELKSIHLLESPVVSHYITQYPVDGDNRVSVIKYENNKVYINDTQYFSNVTPLVWKFYIGGNPPAQKWLENRNGCQLTLDDILHYQSMIVALHETDRLMKEIDKIEIE